ITAQSGREIDFSGSTTGVDLGGTNAADVMGWGLTSQTNPTYFNGLGFTGPVGTNPPDELILGVPSSSTAGSATYSNADASITDSTPHQPLVVQTASSSFTIGSNWVESWRVTNPTMFFGTGPTSLGSTSECVPASPCGPQGVPAPEPSSLALLGTGILAVAW